MATIEQRDEAEARAWRLLRQVLIASQDETQLAEMLREAQEKGIDWAAFTRLADLEHVTPLVADAIKGRRLVPPAVERALVERLQANSKRNLYLLHELSGIRMALREAGVETIVLKGAALAETTYRTMALRMMRDLDLLVPPAQVETALGVLAKRGFERLHGEAREGAHVAYENEVALVKAGQVPVYVEIHWSLFDSPFYQRLPLDWFWDTSASVETGSGRMRTLSREGQILHQAGHLQLHHVHDRQLLWYFDLLQLVDTAQGHVDWNVVVSKAKAYHLVLAVRETLETLAQEWGGDVPQKTLEALATAKVSEEEREAIRSSGVKRPTVAQRFWTDLRLMPSWRQRLHYAWINLFPSPEYMYGRYRFTSAAKLPFYYMYRLYVGLYGERRP